MYKNLLKISDIPQEDILGLLDRARKIKQDRLCFDILNHKCIILLFEKASTRTRISFEIAIRELGGYSIFMTPAESQLGREEPLKDTARVLDRYAHGLVARTFAQQSLDTIAQYCSIPVINALSDMFHPCQVLSDLLTIYERTPSFEGLKVAWVGDGNNMCQSWINAAMYLPFQLHIAVPQGYEPDRSLLNNALDAGAHILFDHNPQQAVKDAHFVNTDVWASMGKETSLKDRIKKFEPFQINKQLLESASSEVKVMHCLPAHRDQEITEDILEGERSIVWDQAENRLHMQKALLEWIYSA